MMISVLHAHVAGQLRCTQTDEDQFDAAVKRRTKSATRAHANVHLVALCAISAWYSVVATIPGHVLTWCDSLALAIHYLHRHQWPAAASHVRVRPRDRSLHTSRRERQCHPNNGRHNNKRLGERERRVCDCS